MEKNGDFYSDVSMPNSPIFNLYDYLFDDISPLVSQSAAAAVDESDEDVLYFEPDPFEDMILQQVVPDVINVVPKEVLKVTYPDEVKVDMGNALKPTQVKNAPTIVWKADVDSYYTVYMGDLDAPSRAMPICMEWQHWLVGNILGNYVNWGETLTAYEGPSPSHGTGPHRYVFLVYRQNEEITFNEERLTTPDECRGFFSIGQFSKKYNLGQPVAGNFFVAKYQEEAPVQTEFVWDLLLN